LPCLSVHMEQLGSHWTDFCEILYLSFFKRKSKCHWDLMGIMGTLHKDKCTFSMLPCLVLRMRNVSDKSVRAKENTFYTRQLFKKNHSIYEIMWKSSLEMGKPQMMIWHMSEHCMHWMCLDVMLYIQSLSCLAARSEYSVSLLTTFAIHIPFLKPYICGTMFIICKLCLIPLRKILKCRKSSNNGRGL
jgi:hypothetical protein